MSNSVTTAGTSVPARPTMGIFERFLTFWVALCIIARIALGQIVPGFFHVLGEATVAQVNIPVAVLVWLMIIPMLLKIDLAALGQVGQHWRGIASTVGVGTVTITRHSLGSALATYLTLDVAVKLGDRVTAWLFASPRTGDGAWAKPFDSKVTSYELYNYILDLVTHVPSLGCATLSKATVLEPSKHRPISASIFSAIIM